MSASGPPYDEVSASHDRAGRRSFAWGKSLDSSHPIVGRGQELARIEDLLEASRGGVTGALLVEGEPGIGKTTVLEATARLATGFRCVRADGFEAEAVLAYAGLVQVITPIRSRLGEIPPSHAATLCRALGWSPLTGSPADGAGDGAGDAERFLVAAALLSLLAAESEHQPVLVLVDDLQWVDPESVDALAFAARRLSEAAVCFVWTARRGALPRLPDGLPVLSLSGLPAEVARALLPERVADPVLDRLVASTGGNPLALLEAGSALTDAQRVGSAPLPDPLSVGDRLSQLYGGRLADLSGPARRAVLLTALNRSGSSATVTTALLRLGLDAGAALDEAEDQGVLVRVGQVYRFRHPLLRTATVVVAAAPEQRRAHQALADALTADPPSLAEAWHRAEAAAGPDGRLALDLVRAADRSRERLGYAAASAALERAAQLCEDARTAADWTAIAAADAFHAGDLARTRDLSARVLDAHGSRTAEGRALFTLGMLEQYAGSVPESAALLAAAAERLDGGPRVWALAELALVRFRLSDLSGLQACAVAIAAAASRDDPQQRMLSDFTQGAAAVLGGDPARGRTLLTDVIEQISEPPLRDDPQSLLFLAVAAGFVGNPGEVMALGSHQMRLARSRGALGTLVPVLTLSAAGRAWLGDHAGAFADAGEAVELGEQLGFAADTAVGVEMLAWQLAARGLHEDAAAALVRARALTDRAGTTTYAARQAITAAFCALSRGEPSAAVLLLEARLVVDGGVGSMGEPLGVAPDLVEAYLAVGRQSDARALAQRFADATPPTAPAWQRALAVRCVAITTPDPDLAREAFDAALTAHSDGTDSFEAARSRLLYGQRLRREGQRVRAREQLRAAHDAFAGMDLAAWTQRAAAELAATGAAPRDRFARVTEPLTSQETRVALHAADGLSNRQIAAALFLSPKTVEHHLSNVYRKRGYRSRAELAASFRRGEAPRRSS